MKKITGIFAVLAALLMTGTLSAQSLSATKVELPRQEPMPLTLDALKAAFGKDLKKAEKYSAPDAMFEYYEARNKLYLVYTWEKPMTIFSHTFGPGMQLAEGSELFAMKPEGRTKGKFTIAANMVCMQMNDSLKSSAYIMPGTVLASFAPAAFFHNSLAENSAAGRLPGWGAAIRGLWESTGICDIISQTRAHFSTTWTLGLGRVIMVLIALVLIYLAIVKEFEPLLLLPIGFGALLANIPLAGISGPGGLQHHIYQVGIESGVFPLLIFMGVGAMTDFGPLIANPRLALLGGAAQVGIFGALLGALALNAIPGLEFSMKDAASIGIIGGADGPTSIFLCTRLSPSLLGAVAVAAYSYMALVPIIQPPIMKLLTTDAERKIRMKQVRPVSKLEKIVFPIIITLLCLLLLPDAAPLIGLLMFGNLMRECGVVERLSQTAQNALINIVTIFLGIAVGSKLAADQFLSGQTLGILFLGCVAFALATAGGVLFAKLMNVFSKDKINPLIGSAGVSAVPMAARVSNKVGLEYDSQNYLLMHAMGPNVAGVIGSAVAAGVLLKLCGSL